MTEREYRLRARIDVLTDRVEVGEKIEALLSARIEELERSLVRARSRRNYWCTTSRRLQRSRAYWKQIALGTEQVLWRSRQGKEAHG